LKSTARRLPVFPLAPDPVRPDVSRDAFPVRLEIDPTGRAHGPRIALVTLGCDKNTVDSERMMAALVGHGARVSSDPEGAEAILQVRAAALCDDDRLANHLQTRPGHPFTSQPEPASLQPEKTKADMHTSYWVAGVM